MEPQWHWCVLAVPALLGFLSAGQQVQAKQGSDFISVLGTGWGSAYWFSRVAVPVAGYVVWYWNQAIPRHSALAATAWGLGSELVLRSKFYIGSRAAPNGERADILKGAFDLIEWWQGVALSKASIALAERKTRLVNRLTVAETDFPRLCARVKDHAGGLDDAQRDAVVKKTSALLGKFEEAGGSAQEAEQHRKFSRELCYLLHRLVGKRGLLLLINRD